MPKINSLEVVHQDTNKDSYQNLHDILKDLLTTKSVETIDGTARASIENILEMYANDKEAFLRSVQTLTTTFKNSSAIFNEEILLRASEIEAMARRVSTLAAIVENANAAIYREENVRATEDEALAQSIQTVSATVGSKNRTYYQTTPPTGSISIPLAEGDLWIDLDDGDKLYRYNGSSWDNIQDAQIGVNTSAITNESIARATGDSANATSINAVTARLNTGDFATVKTVSESSALKLQTRANLISEITNWTLGGGFVLSTAANGLVANSVSGGTITAESPFFPVAAGETYTITGDSRNAGSAGFVYFDIQFYNDAGINLKDGNQNIISGVHLFASDDTNRNLHAVADTAPTGATKAKARFVASGVDTSGVGFRQVKVERGGLPATPFSQETTVNYASAKWGVTVDANGNAAGIALMADSTGTSEFVVAANKFRVKKPDGTDGISWNGTNSRLDISGDVYANNFYGNVVGTSNINSNAVTLPISETRYDVVNGSNTYVTVSSATFTSTETTNVLIILSASQGYSATGSTNFKIYVDGVEKAWRGGSVYNDYPSIAWAGSVTSGSHTIEIKWNGENSNIRIQDRTLAVWVAKR